MQNSISCYYKAENVDNLCSSPYFPKSDLASNILIRTDSNQDNATGHNH